jgi:hypothetical protein
MTGTSGTDCIRKEIQFALQSIAVTVAYFPGVGANPIEQCFHLLRQPPERFAAVGLDPPSIRVQLAAL